MDWPVSAQEYEEMLEQFGDRPSVFEVLDDLKGTNGGKLLRIRGVYGQFAELWATGQLPEATLASAIANWLDYKPS